MQAGPAFHSPWPVLASGQVHDGRHLLLIRSGGALGLSTQAVGSGIVWTWCKAAPALMAKRRLQVFAACGEGKAGAVTMRGLAHELDLLHEAPGYLQVSTPCSAAWSLVLGNASQAELARGCAHSSLQSARMQHFVATAMWPVFSGQTGS